ncbi:hypothetical protein [Candidatus Enterococcus moelleringii]|nr:hypothetical protein [Enterococcus sp. 669A]
MEKVVLAGKMLKGSILSKDWQSILTSAADFRYSQLGEISLVYPLPNGEGSLVVMDDIPYLTKEGSLAMVQKFFKTHRMMDYRLMKHTCRLLPALPSKKIPIVNAHFGLFPIETPENSVWLNPLSIVNVQAQSSDSLVELTSGLSLELPIHRKSLTSLASKAVYTFATYRQDYSAVLRTAGLPLDFVSLPDTPFGRLLERQALLQRWLLTPGRFFDRYKQLEHLQWFRSLREKDFDTLDD